jgi:hypothetical protein
MAVDTGRIRNKFEGTPLNLTNPGPDGKRCAASPWKKTDS